MPNRKRSASRSASPSQSRSRTCHDNGSQRDGDNDEEQIENLNENVQGIANQGVDGDIIRMLEMRTLVMVQSLKRLIPSCYQ